MASTAVIYDLIARDRASTQFGRVGRAADGLGGKMAKLGVVAKGLGVGLAAAGAAAAEAADKAAEFQSSMTKIQTLAGASAKDVAGLTKQVLKLAPSTQQGPQKLAEALYHLKSVGMDNAKAMTSLKVASDLAAVGGADLEETTNALAGAWRTGIKGAGSFKQAAQTVNAVIGAGNMTMEDFVAAIGTGILPSAKTFGLSMGQVGAALALFTDEGVPAQAAATRLRMSISLLGAPSAAAEKQLKKIGLTGLDLANAMRGKDGIIGAIQLLKDHLDASGLSASQQAQILSHAFGGGRSSSAILSMVNNLDVLKKKQDQVNKTTGRYADAVKAQRKTAEAQWKILTSNLETMTIKLGTKLLPPITKFLEFVNKTAIPAIGDFTRKAASMVPVKKIQTALGTVKTSFVSFFKHLGDSTGISSFWDALMAPPPEAKPDKIVSTAKHPYGTSAPKLTYGGGPTSTPYGNVAAQFGGRNTPYGNVAATTTMAIGPYGNVAAQPGTGKTAKPSRAKVIADNFVRIMQNLPYAEIGKALGKILDKAISWAVDHLDDWSQKIAKAIQKIDWVNVGKTVGSIALPVLIGFVDNLFAPLFTKKFWKDHWWDTILAVISVVPIGKVGGLLGKIADKIPWGKFGELISKAWGKIPWGKIFSLGGKINWGKIFSLGGRINWSKVLTLGDVGPAIGRALSSAGRGTSDWLSGIKASLGRQFPKLGSWISDQLTLLPVRIGDLGRSLKGKFSTLISDTGTWLTKHVPGLGNKFTRGIAKAIGRFSFYQTGSNLVVGLYNGISAKVGQAYTWVKKNWIDPFIAHVKSLFGVHSPSTVFAGIGGNLVAGLKNGILGAVKGLGTWVKVHMIDPVTSRFSGAKTWLTSRGGQVVSGLKSGVKGAAKGIATWAFTHVAQPLTSRFSAARTWLTGRGSQTVSGLKSGALGAAKGIGTWAFTHIAQPLTSRFSGARSWLTGRGGQLISGLKSGITSKLKGIGRWVKGHIVDPVVNAVKHYFGIHSPSTVFASLGNHLTAGLLKGMAQTGGTAIARKVFGSLPNALASIVGKGLIHITSLPGRAMKALAGLGGKLAGLLGGLFGGGGGSGVGKWSGDVAAVLAMLGAPSSALGAVLKRIQIESGGNPNAINLWDMNALAGHPSQGLMQTIPSTFNAYAGPFRSRGITDPLASIYAGVNYAMHRYGKNWISVMTRPGGYDQGGVATGMGYLPKYTPRPERVLSPRQTVAFEQLVAALGRITSGGGSDRPIHVHVHVDDPALKDLIRVEVDNGLDELGTALGVS